MGLNLLKAGGLLAAPVSTVFGCCPKAQFTSGGLARVGCTGASRQHWCSDQKCLCWLILGSSLFRSF